MTAKLTHIAVFANNEGPIHAVGIDAEDAILGAVRDTGLQADQFKAVEVTPRMGAFLNTAIPSSWNVVDDRADIYVHSAVFSHDLLVWNREATEELVAYNNLHGDGIESDDAEEAVLKACAEAGVDASGEYVVVSYPVTSAFEDLFEEVGSMVYALRDDVNRDLISAEAVEV